jgi:hypothetical protein
LRREYTLSATGQTHLLSRISTPAMLLGGLSSSPQCRYIVIAAMQRSGSTELAQDLGELHMSAWSAGLRDLQEFFLSSSVNTHSGSPPWGNRTRCGGLEKDPARLAADPVRELEFERIACCARAATPTPCAGVVLKLFDTHLTTQARRMILCKHGDHFCSTPQFRTWVDRNGYLPLSAAEQLLRHQHTCTVILEREPHASWCSFQVAQRTNEFRAHIINGTRVRPTCAGVRPPPAWYLAQHTAWYAWLWRTLGLGSGTWWPAPLNVSFDALVSHRRQTIRTVMDAFRLGGPAVGTVGADNQGARTISTHDHENHVHEHDAHE